MAKKKSPAFQFYPDAWLSSTDIQLMSPAEEGAFIRLLCHAWLQPDGGLPDDDSSLATLSRLGAQWRKSGPRLRAKFITVDGRLFNPRLKEEREKQHEWSAKSKAGGDKSAATRWGPNGKGGYQMVSENGQPKCNSSSSSSSSSSEATVVASATPPISRSFSVLEQDSGLEAFMALWAAKGQDLASDVDWADFRKFDWAPAGFERQRACLVGAEAHPGPFFGTPRSWWRKLGWTRVPNPAAPVRGSSLPPNPRTAPAKDYDASKELD